MKRITFKNPVKINCNLLGEINEVYGYHLIECEAILFEQNIFNGHKFYIAKIQNGFRLVEYYTGIPVGGSYPDKTTNKAAEWFKLRLENYGSAKILQAIHDTLGKLGYANGIEKQYLIDGKTISYSNLPEIGADEVETRDLDSIPCPYTYYLTNGLTVKRII